MAATERLRKERRDASAARRRVMSSNRLPSMKKSFVHRSGPRNRPARGVVDCVHGCRGSS
jgi:hypothetical protein